MDKAKGTRKARGRGCDETLAGRPVGTLLITEHYTRSLVPSSYTALAKWEMEAQAGTTGRLPGTQGSLGAPLNMRSGVTSAPVPKASFAPKATPLLLEAAA